MASGYVTSDGKDLDARYLGINAKASSAKTADTATTATTATNVSKTVKRVGDFVTVSYTLKRGDKRSYSMPFSGLCHAPGGAGRIGASCNNFSLGSPAFLNYGEVITISTSSEGSWDTANLTLYLNRVELA